jgi:hypothetical protein
LRELQSAGTFHRFRAPLYKPAARNLKITPKEEVKDCFTYVHIALDLSSPPDRLSRVKVVGHSVEHREVQ